MEGNEHREVATCTLAPNERKWCAIILLRIENEVLCCVVTVIRTCRIGILRGEAVADRDARETKVVGEELEGRVLRLLILKNPAATVDVHEDAFDWVAISRLQKATRY